MMPKSKMIMDEEAEKELGYTCGAAQGHEKRKIIIARIRADERQKARAEAFAECVKNALSHSRQIIDSQKSDQPRTNWAEVIADSIQKLAEGETMQQNKISESIWSNGNVVIPMAEVSYCIRTAVGTGHEGLQVVMKHSKWNQEVQEFDPNVFMSKNEGDKFLDDWCFYRHEIEGGERAFKLEN